MSRTCVGLAFAMLALCTACTPNESTAEAERSTAEKAVTAREPETGLTPVSVLIAHRVNDYDTWKRVFDDHVEARENASCSGHYLKRGVDDTAMIYVYCPATDEGRLRAFLDSEDLADTMMRAGVEGQPSVTVMRLASRNLVSGQMLPGIIMMHSVNDYGAWRVAYDGLEDFRLQSGIVGHAVGRKLDDPNYLVVYHQAQNLADLRAFVDSAELNTLMQSAGALVDLEIHFIRVVGFESY